jgi:hypothetical protein
VALYDGATKLGEITQGRLEFTAKNLTPGYHVCSVLGTNAGGDIRPSNPVKTRGYVDLGLMSTNSPEYSWEACLSVADAVTKVAPERASGWIVKSLALRGPDRIQEAFDVLLSIVNDFPHVPAPTIWPAMPAAWIAWTKPGVGWRKRARRMEEVGLRQWRRATWI